MEGFLGMQLTSAISSLQVKGIILDHVGGLPVVSWKV